MIFITSVKRYLSLSLLNIDNDLSVAKQSHLLSKCIKLQHPPQNAMKPLTQKAKPVVAIFPNITGF